MIQAKKYVVYSGAALASILLGLSGAVIMANETNGYVAGYTYFALFLLCSFIISSLLISSIALLFSSTVRWVSGVLVMSAFLIVASYVTSFKTLQALGRVQYEHEQMKSIGPDVTASVVVYFKTGTTDDEISYFWNNVLSRPDPRGAGQHRSLDGLQSVLRASALENHEAVAFTFKAGATPIEREQIMQGVKSYPPVHKVLENVAPADVKKIE